MATDVPVYDDGLTLRTSHYARIHPDRTGNGIQVRNSAYADGADNWGFNFFPPEAARRLARYILELADDTEKNPAAEEMARALQDSAESSIDYYEQAEFLIAMGYRK
jgi:predicted alpha-1,6-mannanase (GH76 family)